MTGFRDVRSRLEPHALKCSLRVRRVRKSLTLLWFAEVFCLPINSFTVIARTVVSMFQFLVSNNQQRTELSNATRARDAYWSHSICNASQGPVCVGSDGDGAVTQWLP